MSTPLATSPAAAPLAPVLGFTALTSFAAGTATISVFFVTARAPYEFTAVQQYALGLLVGVGYTLGALGAARLRRALFAQGRSARVFLALLSCAMAAVLCLPLATRADAGVFLLLAIYSPLTGFLWPLVEAYVSGARRAGELRSAIGRFNITWSCTLLASFLVPALLSRSAESVFVAVAATHLLATLWLFAFPREPGEHEEEAHAVPPGYRELLRVHRVLHAVSYLVMYALSPVLPGLLARLGVAGLAASWLGGTWLLSRAVFFVVLERWHGWHGRWSAAVVGTLLVLAGFGTTLLAPGLGAGGVPLVGVALFVFGAGLALLYTAALYYAFEVGGSEGGGSHEALIGLGYSIGPSCGLLVCGLERGGLVPAASRDGVLLALITLICLGGAWLAWRRRRSA